MTVLKLYEYVNCSTCKKALRFLLNNRYAVDRVDIFQNPPSKSELEKMVAFQAGDFRKVINTAGRAYQEIGLKEKLKTMTEDQVLTLLASNGRLIKRPFLLTEKVGLIGFDPAEWAKLLK